MKLKFSKAKEDFFLMAKNSTWKDKLRLEILDIEISLKTSKISKDVAEAHTRALAGGVSNAIYPIIESSVNFHSIAAGLKQVDIHSVYQGILPSTLMW